MKFVLFTVNNQYWMNALQFYDFWVGKYCSCAVFLY